MATNNGTAVTDGMSSDYLDYILSNATATTDEMSSYDIFYRDEISLPVEYWEYVVRAIIDVLIAIAGIIGNSMIIAAVSFSKKLQTSTNAFVISLSVADLLTAFLIIWFEYNVTILGANWVCQFTFPSTYACFGVSMWALGDIAINRLIFIVKPIWYKNIYTSWKLGIIVAIPWVIPTASVIVIFAQADITFDKSVLDCDVAGHAGRVVFEISLLIIGLLFPLLAIVISYLWIYLFVRNHFRKQKQNAAIPTSSSGNSTSEEDEESAHDPNTALADQRRKEISKQEIEITKILFYCVVGFIMVFLPYLITQQFEKQAGYSQVQFYLQILPFSNCAINFVIYALKHPDFKVVLRHMMRCSYADIPQPTPLLRYILSRNN